MLERIMLCAKYHAHASTGYVLSIKLMLERIMLCAKYHAHASKGYVLSIKLMLARFCGHPPGSPNGQFH
jgi:hypothetical protein